MRMFIPPLGTEIVLEKEWEFVMVIEGRNKDIMERYFPAYTYTYMDMSMELYDKDRNTFILIKKEFEKDFYHKRPVRTHQFYDFNEVRDKFISDHAHMMLFQDNLKVTLPPGTNLKIDRVYLRKGLKSYDSITFWAKLPGEKKKMSFFAKLDDVNKIGYVS